jgi:murein DD-endopeptidase MepM/ murein hydrolase activator NlpD
MNRFGKLILGLLVLAAIAVGTMIRFGGAPTSPPRPAEPAAGPASTPQATMTPSGLVIPVAGVQAAQLTDTFGDPRGDGTRGHGALDIMAPAGTPVLAADGGTVEKLFESENGGHTIYIRSANGKFVFYYAHLQDYRPGLAEGDYVAKGAQIGTVGSTGDANVAAPHLHFEVKRMADGEKWHEGEGINPYPLLAGTAAPR